MDMISILFELLLSKIALNHSQIDLRVRARTN